MLIDKKFSFFGWVSLVQGERGLKKNKTSTLCSMRHDSKLIILLLRHPLPTYTYISPKSIELQRKHREIQIKILCFNLSVSLDASLTAVCPGLNFFFSNLKFSYVYKKEKNVWQVAIGKTLKVRFLFKKSHMTCYASSWHVHYGTVHEGCSVSEKVFYATCQEHKKKAYVPKGLMTAERSRLTNFYCRTPSYLVVSLFIPKIL